MTTFQISFAGVAFAFAVSLLGAPAPAQAGPSSISTPAGCNKSGDKAACVACVKSKGRYRKSGGSWSCDAGAQNGGRTEDQVVDWLKSSKPMPTSKPPAKPKLSSYYSAYVSVSPATYWMGSPDTEKDRTSDEDRTKITVTKGFKMKTTEVTEGEWYNVMGEHHHTYKAECGWDCPVTEVNWHEAIAYLNALSKREKLEACYDTDAKLPVWTKGLECKGYRLPTEAEWELAARGGTTEARHGTADDIAWTSENSDSKLQSVGKKQANAFGLYDMLGNTFEWVWDAWNYKTPASGSTDPVRSGDENVHEGSDRTVRGGGFYYGMHEARAAMRRGWGANNGGSYIGFRPVRSE